MLLYVCSDHLPLRVVVTCDLATNHHCGAGRNRNDFIDWKTAGVLINRVNYMKVRLTGCMEILSKA